MSKGALIFGADSLAFSGKVKNEGAAKQIASLEKVPVYPVAEVERGLEGRGYTVFASAEGLEPFDVKVLGVMPDMLGPGEPLIIAELSGAKIEETGVISGMSGSPVYVNGKILGAVGYRFGSFTNKPIAGITPAERMLLVNTPPKTMRYGERGTRTQTREDSARKLHPITHPLYGVAEPVKTPLWVAGFHPEAVRIVQEQRGLSFPFDVHVSGGGAFKGKKAPESHTREGQWAGELTSGQVNTGTPTRGRGPTQLLKQSENGHTYDSFFPGGPIAGLMLFGDFSAAGVGTVTTVDGDRFTAFGHPFNGEGESFMPVASAKIVTTVASDAGSWKMGHPVQLLGRLTDDRLHAIAGTTASFAETVGVEIKIDDETYRPGTDAFDHYKFEVAQHPKEVPSLVMMALGSALFQRVELEPGGTWDLNAKIEIDDGRILRFRRRSAADADMAWVNELLMSLMQEFSFLTDNPDREVRFRRFSFQLKRRDGVHARWLDSVSALPVVDELGGEMSFMVRMRNYRGKTRYSEIPVALRVAAGLPEGRYPIIIVAGHDIPRFQYEAGILKDAKSLNDVLSNWENESAPEGIHVYTNFGTAGYRHHGGKATAIRPMLGDLIKEEGFQPLWKRIAVLPSQEYSFGALTTEFEVIHREQQ